MRYEAVIFDMDGVLLDSERVALEAFAAASDRLGVTVDRTVYLQCVGGNADRTRRILLEAGGETFPYDAFVRVWTECFEATTGDRGIPLKDGVTAVLERTRRTAVPMAVATSTGRAAAMPLLERGGLVEFFDLVVTGDQVRRSKPAPDIYLATAEGLGVPPERCLAIEDSDNGVRSAHAAGMTVIQVPDLLEPSDDLRALGHLVLPSLADVERHLREA